MLYAVHFHRNRRRGDMTYAKRDGPFRMLFVSADRVPQQQIGYDSFKFYILSKSVLITFHSNGCSYGELQGRLWCPYFEND